MNEKYSDKLSNDILFCNVSVIRHTLAEHLTMTFGSKIISWYEVNKRDLPWRHTRNPYLIWLSEIIMQQTRIEQGLSYYNRFAERFPDVHSLASADIDEILKLWQGLGYYSRARNLHAASKQVIEEFHGEFPPDFEQLKSLKGVGEYTASAISSFAFDHPHPVVDGNVFRLLSRYLGIFTPVDTGDGKKEFLLAAKKLIKGFEPAVYNQAIMEFGSVQCKPANPDCSNCVLNASCEAFRKKSVSSLPVKKGKTKTRNRYFNYLVIRDDDSFFIRKRTEKDIWQGLHDFPVIETSERSDGDSVMGTEEWKRTFGDKKTVLKGISREYKHVLSHQLIHARFYEIDPGKKFFTEPAPDWKRVSNTTVVGFAVPRLIEMYLEDSGCIKVTEE